jgi:hypothetical protein
MSEQTLPRLSNIAKIVGVEEAILLQLLAKMLPQKWVLSNRAIDSTCSYRVCAYLPPAIVL